MELRGRNVNSVWLQGLRLLQDEGRRCNSRNGPVVEAPYPVMTVYEQPRERVLFDPGRDANPFFHLFEALWILAGRDDVAWLAEFLPKIKDYSDDGETFHGAYGKRLRYQFDRAVELLHDDPSTRRVVLAMWNAQADLGTISRDLPCNTHLYVKLREGQLLMTVCNRSNDIIWGLYGANAVQWSMVQEYLAAKLGVSPGPLTTVSDSFHAYVDNPTWQASRTRARGSAACPYAAQLVVPWPLMDVPSRFDEELERFMIDPLGELTMGNFSYRNSFFWQVAEPMYHAWCEHRANKNGLAILEAARDGYAGRTIDWIAAGCAWLERRETRNGHARRPVRSLAQAGGAGRRSPGHRTREVRR